jgi:membrane protein insertase Oxa1/YidC/SpoIIIJ
MQLLSTLLSNVDPNRVITFLGDTYSVSLNWIGRLIRGLIEGVGIVGVGVILFSVILKLIVLPLDIYQRVNMSKQNAKMQENQEKLAKLQKQYANDKETYNRKMMELYKESGINVFSSCLPMILSIVIFIVAINAFTDFSNYANLNGYNKMVRSYNAELTKNCAVLEESNISEISEGEDYYLVKEDGKYIYYVVEKNSTEVVLDGANKIEYIQNANKTYFVDSDALYADKQAEIDALIGTGDNAITKDEACVNYIKTLAQKAVKDTYKNEVSKDLSFLWIKNIWSTDASYKHPVMTYSDFKGTLAKVEMKTDSGIKKFSSVSTKAPYDKTSYNLVTGALSEEKNQANGYYILIVLSIGTILLQQIVAMKMQKAQQKYSSVDGQAGMNQKTMLVVMTIMFAIFSFMYSAAFSVYMITSNVLSLLTTVVINAIVTKTMEKKSQKALQEKYDKRFYQNRMGNKNKKK